MKLYEEIRNRRLLSGKADGQDLLAIVQENEQLHAALNSLETRITALENLRRNPAPCNNQIKTERWTQTKDP